MNKTIKTAFFTLALLAVSASALSAVVYSVWSLVAWVIGTVLVLSVLDYRSEIRPLQN